jgi:hypothetical protein
MKKLLCDLFSLVVIPCILGLQVGGLVAVLHLHVAFCFLIILSCGLLWAMLYNLYVAPRIK